MMHWTANLSNRYSSGDFVIIRDVACEECSYNLRGLAADGRCPECGTNVRLTLEHLEGRSHLVSPVREHAGSWLTVMTLATLGTLAYSSCFGALLLIILVPVQFAHLLTAIRVGHRGFTTANLASMSLQRAWVRLTRLGAAVGLISSLVLVIVRHTLAPVDVEHAILLLLPWWITCLGEGFMVGLIAARSYAALGFRWVESIGVAVLFAVPLAALLHLLLVVNAASDVPGGWVAIHFATWPLAVVLPAATLALLGSALAWMDEPIGEILALRRTSKARTPTDGEHGDDVASIPLKAE